VVRPALAKPKLALGIDDLEVPASALILQGDEI
jgi:hypothetical protein